MPDNELRECPHCHDTQVVYNEDGLGQGCACRNPEYRRQIGLTDSDRMTEHTRGTPSECGETEPRSWPQAMLDAILSSSVHRVDTKMPDFTAFDDTPPEQGDTMAAGDTTGGFREYLIGAEGICGTVSGGSTATALLCTQKRGHLGRHSWEGTSTIDAFGGEAAVNRILSDLWNYLGTKDRDEIALHIREAMTARQLLAGGALKHSVVMQTLVHHVTRLVVTGIEERLRDSLDGIGKQLEQLNDRVGDVALQMQYPLRGFSHDATQSTDPAPADSSPPPLG